MWCEELIQLTANYAVAAAAYYASVAELEEGLIRGTGEIFAQRRRSVEEARTICEAARQELDDHVSRHDCGR